MKLKPQESKLQTTIKKRLVLVCKQVKNINQGPNLFLSKATRVNHCYVCSQQLTTHLQKQIQDRAGRRLSELYVLWISLILFKTKISISTMENGMKKLTMC